VTAITEASIADAKLLLVTNKGSSGDTISHKTDVTVDLTSTTAVAADLKAINGETTGLVDASTVQTITALAAADYALVGGASATGNAVKTKSNVAVTFDDAISAANVNTVRGLTGGVVTATVTAGTAADLVTGLSNSGEDALTLSLTAATQAADKINTLNGLTSVPIVASAATKITGLAADINTVLTAVTAGTVGALKTGVEIDVSAGSVAMAHLKAIEAATTGFVDASLVTGITAASIDDAKLLLVTNKGSSGDAISHKSSVTVDLTSTTAVAADLKAIDGETTGLVDASTVQTITALAAADYALVGGTLASGNAVKTKSDVAVTFDDAISAANVDTVRGLTEGVVTATVTAGTAADLVTALTNTGVDALTLSLTAATQAADKINTLNGLTSAPIVANLATEITGTATNIATLLGAVTAGTVGALKTDVALTASAANNTEATSIFAATTTGVTTVALASYSAGATFALRAGDKIDLTAFSSGLTGTADAAADGTISADDGWDLVGNVLYFDATTAAGHGTIGSITITGTAGTPTMAAGVFTF
jgi:hypothetical protein